MMKYVKTYKRKAATMDVTTTSQLYDPMPGLFDQKVQRIENAARTLSNHINADNDLAQTQKAGKEFEAYFISYLIKEMRTTVHPGLIKNKEGQEFYSLYDQEIGRLAAESGGLGLSRMLEQTLAGGPLPAAKAGHADRTQVLSPFSR